MNRTWKMRPARRALALGCLVATIHASLTATPCRAQTRPDVARRTVLVHVDGGRPLRLERPGTEEGTWVTVCPSPCDLQLPVEGTYRLDGDGVRASEPFKLDPLAGDRVVVTAHTASNAGLAGGIVLTSVSGVVALVGAFVYMLASGADIERKLQPTGLVLAGIGLIGVAGGVVLIAMNGSTGMVQAPASRSETAGLSPLWTF